MQPQTRAFQIDEQPLLDLRQAPGLLTFLPMLYVAWADAVLAPSQIEAIRSKVNDQPWLREAEKAQLQRWLDPASPPTVAEMKGWLATVRRAAEQMPDARRKSLARFGQEVAAGGTGSPRDRCASPEACTALDEIEDALGVISHEAYRALLQPTRSPTP